MLVSAVLADPIPFRATWKHHPAALSIASVAEPRHTADSISLASCHMQEASQGPRRHDREAEPTFTAASASITSPEAIARELSTLPPCAAAADAAPPFS